MEKITKFATAYIFSVGKYWRSIVIGFALAASRFLTEIWPNIMIPAWFWITSLVGGLIIAQFLAWLDAYKKYENSANKASDYPKYVGRIYIDLIENWKETGISRPSGFISQIKTPPAYAYWKKLDDLSYNLSLDKQTREELVRFLSYFEGQNSIEDSIISNSYMWTKIRTESEILKEAPKIRKLAESLSRRLESVQ